jgi:transcription elongation factor Elf1
MNQQAKFRQDRSAKQTSERQPERFPLGKECPSCRKSKVEILKTGNSWVLWQCPNCALQQLDDKHGGK